MNLKLYSDRKILLKGMEHVAILYPFWGKPQEDRKDPQSGAYDRYIESARNLFQMTSLQEADFAVMPIDWRFITKNKYEQISITEFIERVKMTGKKIIIFFWSDSNEDVPVEDSIIFRTSFSSSKNRKHNEFAMPSWYEDVIEKYFNGKLQLRTKRTRPTVGFCGFASPPRLMFKRKIKDALCLASNIFGLEKKGRLFSKSGQVIRSEALSDLLKSSELDTNFIVRNQFYGGSISWLNGNSIWDFNLKQKVRQEYINNMLGSDYILCIRGSGNYSHRLFDALCCGRIPVFVNTDCILPYDFEIDWKKYCIWIEEKELSIVAKKIVEFHNKISSNEFIELQERCRTLWKNWLSPEGFFTNFHRHFRMK